jgi:hypothetical protein
MAEYIFLAILINIVSSIIYDWVKEDIVLK